MYAYALDGTPITSTKEVIGGTSGIAGNGFKLDRKGKLDCQYDGGTDVDWDSQKPFVENGQEIVLDADDQEWPVCSLVILDHQLEDDQDLPADKVAVAQAAYDAWLAETAAPVADVRRYEVSAPQNGWRRRDSFTPEEKARLRPIAETLAMLDGNAFFGLSTDEAGDDVHYENYLPEAAALVDSNGGWASLASFIRRDAPLPANPMGLGGIRMLGDERIVDLVDEPTRTVRVTGIDWDTTDDDADGSAGLTPHLPTELLVGVATDTDLDAEMADLLSDRYGFCINGIAATEDVTPDQQA